MVFTTLNFVVFFTAVFFIYYSIPKNFQWKFLLVASYVFYSFASPIFLFFLIFTTVVTYLGSYKISCNLKLRDKILVEKGDVITRLEKNNITASILKKNKLVLSVVILLLLLQLGIFKYSLFIFHNFSFLLGVFFDTHYFVLNIILPIGLSFYVFQSLGYCIDVYRELTVAESNYFKYSLFVSFFPQLLQGPIGNYNKLSPQLYKSHDFSYENAKFGLQRVIWGFFKKLVIANQLSLLIDNLWLSYLDYSGFTFWFFILILYSVQLYADFSGYMDIALGCSQMLGINLEENFNTPYFSKNIAEFWRKWHITLGVWFKNYVFYPLLRSDLSNRIRKKLKKQNNYLSNVVPTVLALLVVWFLIGLWHGADWSYVLYGLYHGSFIIFSTLLNPLYSKITNFFHINRDSNLYVSFQIVRTFLIVTFGYILFRPGNLDLTINILHQMFSGLGIDITYQFVKEHQIEIFELSIGIIILFFVDFIHYRTPTSSIRIEISKLPVVKRYSIYVVSLLLVIFLGVYGLSELNQFAYFRF